MNLKVTVLRAPATDDDELERLTSNLRRELLEFDVDAVRRAPSHASPPEGSRAGDLVEAGALVVALATSPALLTALVEGIRAWLLRSQARSVRLEINGDSLELTNIPEADQRRLVEYWIERQAMRKGPSG